MPFNSPLVTDKTISEEKYQKLLAEFIQTLGKYYEEEKDYSKPFVREAVIEALDKQFWDSYKRGDETDDKLLIQLNLLKITQSSLWRYAYAAEIKAFSEARQSLLTAFNEKCVSCGFDIENTVLNEQLRQEIINSLPEEDFELQEIQQELNFLERIIEGQQKTDLCYFWQLAHLDIPNQFLSRVNNILEGLPTIPGRTKNATIAEIVEEFNNMFNYLYHYIFDSIEKYAPSHGYKTLCQLDDLVGRLSIDIEPPIQESALNKVQTLVREKKAIFEKSTANIKQEPIKQPLQIKLTEPEAPQMEIMTPSPELKPIENPSPSQLRQKNKNQAISDALEAIKNKNLTLFQSLLESEDLALETYQSAKHYYSGDIVATTIKSTFLGFALYYNSTDIIKYLINKGASLSITLEEIYIESGDWLGPLRDSSIHTPLKMAVESENLEIVTLLLSKNLGVDNSACHWSQTRIGPLLDGCTEPVQRAGKEEISSTNSEINCLLNQYRGSQCLSKYLVKREEDKREIYFTGKHVCFTFFGKTISLGGYYKEEKLKAGQQLQKVIKGEAHASTLMEHLGALHQGDLGDIFAICKMGWPDKFNYDQLACKV